MRPARDSGQMGHAHRTGTGQTARLLAACALVAADRGVRDRRCALLGGTRGLDADATGIGGIPGAVRLAARPGVPAVMAAGLAPRSLGDGGGARRGNGAAGGGTARPARDNRLCGRDQPPGLDDVVVARWTELKPADARPAAKQGGAVLPPAPPAIRMATGCTCRGGRRRSPPGGDCRHR